MRYLLFLFLLISSPSISSAQNQDKLLDSLYVPCMNNLFKQTNDCMKEYLLHNPDSLKAYISLQCIREVFTVQNQYFSETEVVLRKMFSSKMDMGFIDSAEVSGFLFVVFKPKEGDSLLKQLGMSVKQYREELFRRLIAIELPGQSRVDDQLFIANKLSSHIINNNLKNVSYMFRRIDTYDLSYKNLLKIAKRLHKNKITEQTCTQVDLPQYAQYNCFQIAFDNSEKHNIKKVVLLFDKNNYFSKIESVVFL